MAVALAGSLAAATTAKAADYFPNYAPASDDSALSSFSTEFGARAMLSTGETRWSLDGFTAGSAMVSRLTWPKLTTDTGELYGRIDHSSGLFVKGYAGLGDVLRGSLTDEDFPPLISPYSSTDSNQRKGSLDYFSGDLGYDFWNEDGIRLGAFAGWHYSKQSLNAYGCAETGDNPDVCAPTIPTSVLVISESYAWNGARLGLEANTKIGDRWTFGVDLAYFLGHLNARDTHWLRIGEAGGFSGPTPITGRASGILTDARLDYQLTNNFTIGVGGRYWKMRASNVLVRFDETGLPAGTGAIQFGTVNATTYGGFLEAALKF